MDKTALIIFAREPRDGKVKTRLCKVLPLPLVTRLYKAFVKDAAITALDVKCDKHFLYYAGNGASMPFLRSFQKRFQLKRQTGKDLGMRMHRAFIHCRKERFTKVIIIGTDCPTLTANDIEKAFKKLGPHDCVLGPSKDGGYYLIGLTVPDARLFTGIHWGTPSVLKQTIRKANRLKKKMFLLKKREDIDTALDLKRLSRQIKNTRMALHTQGIIREGELSSS